MMCFKVVVLKTKKSNHILGFIASDHRGFLLKDYLKGKFPLIDLGTFDCEKIVDYPDYVKKLTKLVVKEKSMGIVICGTGIGVSIAANRAKGIRAGLCRSVDDAYMSRYHNNANVLALGADVTNSKDAEKIAKKFFETQFSNEERHKRRIKKMDM
jgi:ribose 5-phosphate isomerase B